MLPENVTSVKKTSIDFSKKVILYQTVITLTGYTISTKKKSREIKFSSSGKE